MKMRFEHTLEVTELVMQITEKRMFQAERMAVLNREHGWLFDQGTGRKLVWLEKK